MEKDLMLIWGKKVMPIPDYQTIMLPLLESLSDGKEHKYRDSIEKLATNFMLSDEERRERLPSGQQSVFDNRVGWAKTYLKKAGLIDNVSRGIMVITDRGRALLAEKPSKITNATLNQYKEFNDFVLGSGENSGGRKLQELNLEEKTTPEEQLEGNYQQINQELAEELLKQVKNSSPAFFENLVVDLITRMGYGGSRKDAGKAIGKSGDGGVDGIINEDKLGLDVIYIQAKRWEGQVPVRDIRDFAGALMGKKAKKGIFITTSSFPASAYDYVNQIDHKIVLINGVQLAEYMVNYNVGVSVEKIYELKKIDSDYFE